MESKIEKKLKNNVVEAGGLCLKFIPTFAKGFPDRIVLMPGGLIWFVETKDVGKDIKPGSLQDWWKKNFKQLGFKHRVVNSEETLLNFIHEISTA